MDGYLVRLLLCSNPKLTFPKTSPKSKNSFAVGLPAAYQIPRPRPPTIVRQIRTWHNRPRTVLSFFVIISVGNYDRKGGWKIKSWLTNVTRMLRASEI